MPDVLKAQSNDIMGRIEQIAACGIPRELLILLSSGLFEAGKAAQRAGAPIGKLADWCHECVLAGTNSRLVLDSRTRDGEVLQHGETAVIVEWLRAERLFIVTRHRAAS